MKRNDKFDRLRNDVLGRMGDAHDVYRNWMETTHGSPEEAWAERAVMGVAEDIANAVRVARKAGALPRATKKKKEVTR